MLKSPATKPLPTRVNPFPDDPQKMSTCAWTITTPTTLYFFDLSTLGWKTPQTAAAAADCRGQDKAGGTDSCPWESPGRKAGPALLHLRDIRDSSSSHGDSGQPDRFHSRRRHRRKKKKELFSKVPLRPGASRPHGQHTEDGRGHERSGPGSLRSISDCPGGPVM